MYAKLICLISLVILLSMGCGGGSSSSGSQEAAPQAQPLFQNVGVLLSGERVIELNKPALFNGSVVEINGGGNRVVTLRFDSRNGEILRAENDPILAIVRSEGGRAEVCGGGSLFPAQETSHKVIGFHQFFP